MNKFTGEKFKVLILTEGGKDIGFGHVTRCLSLYQAFEERGIIPQFIINGDETIKDLLKNKKYQSFNWLKEKEKLFNIARNATFAIIDSYLADLNFYKNISGIVEIPVYINDNKRIDYPQGFIISGAIYAEQLHRPKKKNISYLLGSRYAILRKDFWNVPEKEIKDKIESVIITFGGEDKRNMTSAILRFLNNEYPEFTKNIIIGNGFQNAKEIDDLKDKKTNLIYNPDADKMKRIMIESDLAISAGGQTLYELARVGTPAVGICIADNQQIGMQNWEKVGFLEYVGWCDQKHLLDRLEKAILELFAVNERRKRSRIGRKYVDGKGPSRIIDFLLKLKSEVRL